MERRNYTQEELERAKETSLTALATAMGYTVIRSGRHYKIKEMDSLIIYNDRTWNRFSHIGTRTGGSQIDFLMEFGNCSMVEAVHKLLNLQGIDTTYVAKPHEKFVQKEKGSMILPPKLNGSYRRTYAYLIQKRALSVEVINYFVKDLKLLYEDEKYHNMIFLGKDKLGKVRYATRKGTYEKNGGFRGDVLNNDKNYGINIVNPDSQELNVFEAVIDGMSYLDITGDYSSNMLILGGVADNPLNTFLKEYSHIKKINFRLDRDRAGDEALYGVPQIKDSSGKILQNGREGMLEKYKKLGYQVSDARINKINGIKDVNDMLKYLKAKCPEKVYACQIKQSFRKKKVI